MKTPRPIYALICTFALATPVLAQVTLAPLTSFRGDGWFAPGEDGYTFLGTGSLERGLAYSDTTDHLYLVSRFGGQNVRILDPLSGAEIGALSNTGILTTNTTFGISKVAVGTDGAIYAAGLRTGTAGQVYRVYRWDTESSDPTLVFESTALGNGSRIGDSLDAIGGGAATRLVAGYNTGGTPTPAGANGYAVIDPTASAATPTTPVFDNVMFPGTPPNVGDFRLGITFLDSDTVLGTQGITLNAARLTDFAGASGTLLGSLTLQAVNERALDYITVAGTPLLATLDTSNNDVRLYDMSDNLAPFFLTLGDNTTSFAANANASGDVRFGEVTGNTVTLYALNTNNGIQAFVVTVPEPTTVTLLGWAAAGLMLRRRR